MLKLTHGTEICVAAKGVLYDTLRKAGLLQVVALEGPNKDWPMYGAFTEDGEWIRCVINCPEEA